MAEFSAAYERALARCAAVVLSGSLPPELPPGSYATLIGMAAAAGVPVVLDAHGEALRRGAAARPEIVKPNLAELDAVAAGLVHGLVLGPWAMRFGFKTSPQDTTWDALLGVSGLS